MEKFFVKKKKNAYKRERGEIVISPPPPPPSPLLHHSPPMSLAYNSYTYRQADMEMQSYLSHPPPVQPLSSLLWFYWATDSSSQPALLWLLPAYLPLRSQLSLAWDRTLNRLHRSLTHTHRSAEAVESNLILRIHEHWDKCTNFLVALSLTVFRARVTFLWQNEAVHVQAVVEPQGGVWGEWRAYNVQDSHSRTSGLLPVCGYG